MMIVWIEEDIVKEVKDIRLPEFGEEIELDGGKPDFILLTKREAGRVSEHPNPINYLEEEVISMFKKPSLGNILVDSGNGIIKYKKYLS